MQEMEIVHVHDIAWRDDVGRRIQRVNIGYMFKKRIIENFLCIIGHGESRA